MLTGEESTRIDHLYNLLERERNEDTAAALRWAISRLEQHPELKAQADLLITYAMKPERERDSIIDTGAFNEVIKGYLVIALQDAGKPRSDILDALDALEAAFNTTDAGQARQAYKKL